MRYLVTGGAGFIGSAITRRLAADGHQVRVLDDFSRGHEHRLAGIPCETVRGDIRDPAAVAAAVQGCDRVAHLAYAQGSQVFYDEPRRVLDIAVRGMTNLLAACEAAGCRDLLLVSSSEAYQVATTVPTPESVPCSTPDPLNPRYSYGGGKSLCELMANAWTLAGVLDRAVIARPHNAYGPDAGREHVIPQFILRMSELASGQPEGVIRFPVQGTGYETRSFVYVDDCVDQLVLLLDKAPGGAGIWHVGCMEERTVADVAHAVAACFGREIEVMPGELLKGSPPRRLPDTAKIEALGWDAGRHVPFAAGLAETVEWYRAHG